MTYKGGTVWNRVEMESGKGNVLVHTVSTSEAKRCEGKGLEETKSSVEHTQKIDESHDPAQARFYIIYQPLSESLFLANSIVFYV